jgi:octaprenyl-diphosphate synthase
MIVAPPAPLASLPSRPPRPVASPLQSAWDAVREDLDEVERLLHTESGGPLPIMELISGHLTEAGGKRLRPVLCLLAARLAEIPAGPRHTIAAVSELIHTASLLHDDVVDEAPIRRGRPSAPRVFGNASCVLMGDALMARSLTMLADLPDHEPLASLARCVRRMAVGELEQLARSGSGRESGLLSCLRVVEGKTAALFAWSTSVGGLPPAPLRDPLARFGRRLGIAFQISDDLLDLCGDPARTGKAVGADLAQGKITIPVHLACQRNPELRSAIAAWLEGADPATLPALCARIVESGGAEAGWATVEASLARAERALGELPASIWRDRLGELARALARRSS